MEKTVVIVLENGTKVFEEMPAELVEKDNDELLAATAAALTESLNKDRPFTVLGGQLVSIKHIVEAYIQES